MLETDEENFDFIPFCQSLTKPTEIERKDLTDIPNSHCFTLNNLLTAGECEFYIQECEKVGFQTLSSKFPAYYRVNDRVLTLSHEIANALFSRITPLLTRHDVIRIRPIGFGNEGTWRPIRLNECIKIMKYSSGGHFAPHFDGPWVPREDESSVYTVVIYLNTNYTGGQTKFIDEHDVKRVYHEVQPRVGMGLIFNHDTFHEGTPVLSGVKYLLRTEVMFRRVDTQMIPHPLKYEELESYNTAVTLYRKSHRLERAGDQKGFTDTYLRAITLQMEAQRSVTDDYYGELKRLPIPYELYIKVFGYLSVKDVLCCMRVCRVWYDIAMDGELWFQLYKRRWPSGIKVDLCMNEIPINNPLIIDWNGNFKTRIDLEYNDRCAVIDVGSYEMRCANIVNKSGKIHTSEIRSVVARVEGIYHFHMRQDNFERWFSGETALSRYPHDCTRVVIRGNITDFSLLPEILFGLIFNCSISPTVTPIVCLVSPLHCTSMELKIRYILQHVSNYPCVVCLPQSVAICAANGDRNGIVVNFGYESGWVSLVVSCDPIVTCSEEIELSIQPRELISLIESIVERSQMRSVKFCLSFVGGNLNENLITQLKRCFSNCERSMDYISKVYFNSQSNSTLLAGVEYANSLWCSYRYNTIQYSDRPKDLHIPRIYATSQTYWHYSLLTGCSTWFI